MFTVRWVKPREAQKSFLQVGSLPATAIMGIADDTPG